VNVAVLGPGGVGGLLAGALDRAGIPTTVVARSSTAQLVGSHGLRISSVRLGDFVAHPRAVDTLAEPVDVLIVSPKAPALGQALERIAAPPRVVLPLLNGIDHLAVLRRRFADTGTSVLAGAIRVESDRPQAGVILHTSPFLRVDMACSDQAAQPAMADLAQLLGNAEIPARVVDSEPAVMWGKLVRLNALACTTSAYDKLLGEIRDTPELRAELIEVIREGCAVAVAEGAQIDTQTPLGELQDAHATLGSSMQRDIAAGREPELDAIPCAVLRAGAGHGIRCPTTERLVGMIAERAGMLVPSIDG